MSQNAPEAPAQKPATPEAPAQEPQQSVEKPKGDGTDWKAEARKWEARAKENKTEADTHRQQLDAISKAIGGGEDAPPDPAKLAEQIAAEQAKTGQAEERATNAERQLAIYRAAGKQDANPDALLDSASFLRSITDLDPEDADAVADAIKKAIEANPALKANPAPPSYGGGPRKQADRPDPGPGLPRLQHAYAQSSK